MYIGWFVLELSNLYMYKLFYYNVFKKQFGENVKLQYMNTVSFLLNFKHVDVYKEMKEGKLAEYMDLINFPTTHPMCDDTKRNNLGLLKSETADVPITKAFCFAPKCYRILLDNGQEKKKQLKVFPT